MNIEDLPEYRLKEKQLLWWWALPPESRPADWWFEDKVKELNMALGRERFSIEWKDGRIYGIGINRQDE